MTATLETPRLPADVDLTAPQRGGINISGEKVTESTASLPEEQQLLIRWLFSYAREMNWSWDQVQGYATISKNSLYKIWTGKYTDDEGNLVPLDAMCEKIARVRKLVMEREGVTRGLFVETAIFRKIDKICNEARVMQTIAFIYGESQIGKTFSLVEHARRNNHGQTLFMRMPSSSADFYGELAKACYISAKNPQSVIRAKLFRYLDHTKLLIVDELHLAFEIYTPRAVMRAMETLRELHDQTGCGLVLCGTNVFKHELHHGDHNKMLAQLRKRGIYELQLPAIAPDEDVHAIAASYKLKPPTGEAADLVKLIITKDGLGKFTKFLTKASQRAARLKERLEWDHFIKIHELVLKMGN